MYEFSGWPREPYGCWSWEESGVARGHRGRWGCWPIGLSCAEPVYGVASGQPFTLWPRAQCGIPDFYQLVRTIGQVDQLQLGA